MTTALGRNDPCPCGSGRKFKHCCLRLLDDEAAAKTRLRTAEGVLVPALFAYAIDQFGDEFFAEAWAEFFLWDSVPDDVGESREFGTTFDPFFVFSFVPDPAADDLPSGWPTEPLALHVLPRKSSPVPTSIASSLYRRARVRRASSSSSRPHPAGRSTSGTS